MASMRVSQPQPLPAPPPWPPVPGDGGVGAGGRTAATWVGSVGAGLLLVAATVFAVTNWSVIPLSVKWAALVVLNVAVVAAGERTVRLVPAVARVLQHLGALLVAVSAAATVLAVGGDWPEVVLSAGTAGLLSTAWQSRLRRAPLLEALVPATAVFALAGAAGRSGLPLPLLVAGLSVGVVLARRPVVGARLAATVGLLPLAATLDALPVGGGTAARLGLVGADLAWSAPFAGLLAGTALALVANRRGSWPAALGALVAVGAGLVTGLGALDPSPYVWNIALGATAALVMAASVLTAPKRIWSTVLGPLASLAEVGSVLAALCFVGVGVEPLIEQHTNPALALAALLWASTAVASMLRPAGVRLCPTWLVAMAGLALAMASAGLATGVAAAAAVVGLVAAAAGVWLGAPQLVVPFVGAATMVSLIGVVVRRAEPGPLAGPDSFIGIVLALSGAALVLCSASISSSELGLRPSMRLTGALQADSVPIRWVRRSTERATSWIDPFSTSFAALVAASAGLSLESSWALTLACGAAASAVACAELVRVRQAFVAWVAPVGVFCWGAFVTAMVADAPEPAIMVASWLVVGLFAVAPLQQRASWWSGRSLTIGAAVAVPIALSFWAGGFAELDLVLLIAGGALPAGGLAVLSRRVNPFDAVATALTAAAVVLGWTVDEIATGSALLIGAAVALGIAVLRGPRWIGSIAATLGLVGTMFLISGFDVADSIERNLGRFAVTPSDVGVAVVAALALIGGALLAGQLERPSSWLTVAPGLGLLSWHLLATLVLAGDAWRVVAGLVVGAVATAGGGLRRRSAPLVLGTVLVVSSVALATRTDLARLPVWSWLALGGAGLLAVAVLIERGLDLARRSDVTLADCLLRDFR